MASIAKLHRQIRACRRCRLYRTRKKAVPGEGKVNAKVMFIGEAPGRQEDIQGRPFIGRSGKFLDKLLMNVKLDRKNVFITSVVKCRPVNRAPKKDEIAACKPYLLEQTVLIKPRVIVLLGGVALSSVLGIRNITKHHGECVKRGSITYLPTFHPAAGMRFPRIKRMIKLDFNLATLGKEKAL